MFSFLWQYFKDWVKAIDEEWDREMCASPVIAFHRNADYSDWSIAQKPIVDELFFGELPSYQYDPGTEILYIDEARQLRYHKVPRFRYCACLIDSPTPEEERRFMLLLREQMPTADEFRIVKTPGPMTAMYAVKYPSV